MMNEFRVLPDSVSDGSPPNEFGNLQGQQLGKMSKKEVRILLDVINDRLTLSDSENSQFLAYAA